MAASQNHNGGPLSLLENARNAVLKVTGIDQSNDILPTLNLPKCVIQYLTTEFKTTDFFINKDNVTPEDVDVGIYKAVCRLDDTVVLLKIIDVPSISTNGMAILNQWEAMRQDGIQKCYVSFNEENTRVYAVQYMRRADEIVRQCRTGNTSLSEQYIWYILHRICLQLKYCHDNNLDYPDFQTHKVGFLPNGDVLLQNGILSHEEQLVTAMEAMIMADDMPVGVYSPPEVISEEKTTEKSLTWQIGAVIYEIAGLRPAYQVEDASDVFTPLGEIMEGNLPPALPYSSELNNIVNKCLSFLQECRPSLTELIEVSENMYTEDSAKDPTGMFK